MGQDYFISADSFGLAAQPNNFISADSSDLAAQPDNFISTDSSDLAAQPDNFISTDSSGLAAQPNNFISTDSSGLAAQPDNFISTDSSDLAAQPNNFISTDSSGLAAQPDNFISTDSSDLAAQPDNFILADSSGLAAQPDNFILADSSGLAAQPDNFILADSSGLAAQPDKSSEFMYIIQNKLLPIIDIIFSSYVYDPANFIKPTEYLNTKLKENNGLTILESGFNSIYEIGEITDSDYRIIIKLNKTSFSLLIVPLDNFENTVNTNNIAFSPDRTLKMYVYGVKANGIGPQISGNVLNSAAFLICKAMHIPQLYISDSAGVKCYWDESIELQHFSILRVMAGKPTFYASLPGHFFDEAKAMAEIQKIQESITQEEKGYILHYLYSLKNKQEPSKGDDCNKINNIIENGIKILGAKPEIFRYIAMPYTESSGKINTRKSKKRKSKGRKSKGRKSKGRKSKGRKSKGRKSKGRKSKGRKSKKAKMSRRAIK